MSITFQVSVEDGGFVAFWDAPLSTGGICTQADTLPELLHNVAEAVQCHFEPSHRPAQVLLHFTQDIPLLCEAA